ncbi:hypothetical protein [Actinoplanes sp. URMC 104]|uniref:hypothetical protein n=1 Tax=Actinoplanes sp. URMC 104 TaxID=3423409 RepID=UPI003F1D684A
MSPIFSPAHGVRTEAGRHLQLVASRGAPAQHDSPDDAARRVWEIAFGLAARHRFEPDSPLAEIRRTVVGTLREHPAVARPLDAEMLVREALGEKVPVDEITGPVRTGVHLLLFARLVDELALTDGELESLIAQAEELAVDGELSPRPEPRDAPSPE